MARPTTVTLDELMTTVADYYGISRDDLLGRGRNKELVHPRQVVMYLAREELQLTLPQIGESLAGAITRPSFTALTKLPNPSIATIASAARYWPFGSGYTIEVGRSTHITVSKCWLKTR